ncbi:MAG TPA: Rieske 2Fe-2S domain-containing protein [Bacteroidota bacterium]|nr:Rieske 2Fe-2S domain-containing protein [Bacteroidota bacterium]
MSRQITICPLERFPNGGLGRFDPDGKDLVVARCGDQFYAADNSCAHQHVARLHEGRLEGCILECPMHGWRFDLRTGRSPSGEGRLQIYPVRIVGGMLVCDLPEEA